MANNIDLSSVTPKERRELQSKENARYLGKFYKGSEREKKDLELKK